MSVEGWKIVRDRVHQSAGCCERSRPDEMFAVLELPACIRRDYCPVCFARLPAAGDKPRIFWRVRRRDGQHRPVLDLVVLRHLFDRLGDEPGPRPAALRYFVALLLLRKRLLKMVDPGSPAQEAADLVVVDPRQPTAAPVALSAPDLGERGLDVLKDELLALAGQVDEADAGG